MIGRCDNDGLWGGATVVPSSPGLGTRCTNRPGRGETTRQVVVLLYRHRESGRDRRQPPSRHTRKYAGGGWGRRVIQEHHSVDVYRLPTGVKIAEDIRLPPGSRVMAGQPEGLYVVSSSPPDPWTISLLATHPPGVRSAEKDRFRLEDHVTHYGENARPQDGVGMSLSWTLAAGCDEPGYHADWPDYFELVDYAPCSR